MTLTVVVGASGSGKTTFLNDVAKHHKSFWDIYERVKMASTIKVGGVTMAEDFTAAMYNKPGLSEDQRKLLLFELIRQRTEKQNDLLLVLDEPFAGVTDEFVPFIVQRLNEMRQHHNILLVSNDHEDTPKKMADNTIAVSAIDRSSVQINGKAKVNREKMILALSVGEQYNYGATRWEDLTFFYNVEVVKNGSLIGVAVAFTIFAFSFSFFLAYFWERPDNSGPLIVAASIIVFFGIDPYYRSLINWRDFMTELVPKTMLTLIFISIVASLVDWVVYTFAIYFSSLFLATFLDSSSDSGPMVIVAVNIIAFFCLNSYLLSLADWRNFMVEESEALLHSSKTTNMVLKTVFTLILILIVSLVEWGIVNLVVDGFEDRKFWVMILMDNVSMTFPFLLFGLFTKLPHTAVKKFASMPFLFMIFLSGTFSPSAGQLPVLRELRYLFSRFYFWCLIPGVKDQMENCPKDDLLVLYAVLSAILGLVLFLIYELILVAIKVLSTKKKSHKHNLLKDDEFVDLQIELYGEQVLQKDSLAGTSLGGTEKSVPTFPVIVDTDERVSETSVQTQVKSVEQSLEIFVTTF